MDRIFVTREIERERERERESFYLRVYSYLPILAQSCILILSAELIYFLYTGKNALLVLSYKYHVYIIYKQIII